MKSMNAIIEKENAHSLKIILLNIFIINREKLLCLLVCKDKM